MRRRDSGIGRQDNTALCKGRDPPTARIPGTVPVAFGAPGHSPQMQAPDRFRAALWRGLEMAGQTRPGKAANPAD